MYILITPIKSASAVVSHVRIQSHISFDLCRFLSWFRPEHFITEEELLWIMTRIINVLMLDLFLLQMITDGLWCFYSDGTHSLQSIHVLNCSFNRVKTLFSVFLCCSGDGCSCERRAGRVHRAAQTEHRSLSAQTLDRLERQPLNRAYNTSYEETVHQHLLCNAFWIIHA